MDDELKKPEVGLPADTNPIDWLKPESEQHEFVLQKLMDRLRYSAERMSVFHSRWRSNELKLQAYISLPDYDAMLKQAIDDRGPPAATAVQVPFAWATINTIVTYLLHMFGGRSPIFTVGSYRAEQVQASKNMEMLLQYNSDFVRFVRSLYFFLMDGETYGVAVMRTLWKVEQRTREIIKPPMPEAVELMGQLGLTATGERVEETYVCFEGNTATNIDPFMFFPDPRVPMHEVNEKGEYVFWRSFVGKHTLLKQQALGKLKWVDKAKAWDSRTQGTDAQQSSRGMRSLGESHPGNRNDYRGRIGQNYQFDQGTVEIIPHDWGLGESRVPEKWIFGVLNENQIVQAQKVILPADRHPIEVAEPNSFGYAFGHLGTVDMLGPMQDMMSWFMNSHIYNVRASLNNMFVVDPTKVEMQDLTSPEPGKIIRLKNTAFGLADPKSALYQLPVADVTANNVNDVQLFGRMAADMTGATDNVRGLQEAGGRKTATEVRTSSDAGTSRLAAKGKLYSSMALTGLAEQWSMNYQSGLTQEFELRVLGQEGAMNTIRITPDNINGDFYFPVHDGTLPMDKVGLLDIWRQIFQGVLADPQLRQGFDVISMFKWIAQLGGAQNINSFVVQPQAQQALDLQSGNGVPLEQAMADIASRMGQ